MANSQGGTVLLIGAGSMAREYCAVLEALGRHVVVVGRGERSVKLLQDEFPGEWDFIAGGLSNYLASGSKIPEQAINCTGIECLCVTTSELLESGVKKILVEKPGDLTRGGLQKLSTLSERTGSSVFIAYNRRMFESTRRLMQEVELDGGITSAHFEFTEWSHTFGPETHSRLALERWVLSNSSHVLDTVFYLIGLPTVLNAEVYGKNDISWHPSGSIFAGSGFTKRGIVFSYHANWIAPGRWGIEIMTRKRRFYLKPMESLMVQDLGSIELRRMDICDNLDTSYKPGLFLQTQNFLEGDESKLKSVDDQVRSLEVYETIAGYD